MRAKEVRVMESAGPGLVKQAPMVINTATGKTRPYPITDTNKYREADAKRAGFVCCKSISELNQSTAMNTQPYGVIGAEKVNGMPSVARAELPSNDSGSETFTLTIENGHTAAEQLLLGDGFGILAKLFSIPAKNAATVIGGTYDTDTLNIFKAVSAGSAVRFHGVHIVNTNSGSDSTGFFDSGKMELLAAPPTNNSGIKKRFDLQQLVNSNSFKPSIRDKRDFRYLVEGYTGILFTVPAGETIAVTFNVQSYANAHLMNRDLDV